MVDPDRLDSVEFAIDMAKANLGLVRNGPKRDCKDAAVGVEASLALAHRQLERAGYEMEYEWNSPREDGPDRGLVCPSCGGIPIVESGTETVVCATCGRPMEID